MTRLLVVSTLCAWVGATLLLSRQRWFSRRPLVDRLRLYEPGGLATRTTAPGLLSVENFSEIVGPLAQVIGSRLTRLFGVNEELGVRLVRLHSPLDPTAFRTRQLAWTAAGLVAGLALALVATPPPLLVGLFVVGVPLLTFLGIEQQLIAQSERHKQRLFLELPVVAEQLGMLLSAGFSLGAALHRLAARGKGACGQDLARVLARMRQGLDESEALREWATVADVDALHRLVAVLALNREAGDLGHLIAEEARSVRREVQRQLVEKLEKRSQTVWIPVTVAALVPGAIFIAIPFLQALDGFTRT